MSMTIIIVSVLEKIYDPLFITLKSISFIHLYQI